MRRLIAAVAAGSTVIGLSLTFAGAASATITSPTAGQALRGTVTLSDSGVGDGSLCINGTKPNVTLSLLNSAGTTVFTQNIQATGAVNSNPIDTHGLANGAYTVRAVEQKRSGTLICSNSSTTVNTAVTIDNIVNLSYDGDTSAPQNTGATVKATLTDPNLGSQVLPNRPVVFSLSGQSGTATGTTDANGVATTTLAVSGPPRAATLTASFAATAFYDAKSVQVAFQVNKNSSATTVTQPAPVVHGQATSFSAQVAGTNGTGTPSGTVQFTVDGANYGSPVTLVAGAASSPSTASLSTGAHSIGASYSGDDNYLASSATAKTQQVNKADTTTSLSDDISPSVSGQAVTFTATVDVVAPGVGTPAGAVQFNVDGQPFGTAVPLTGDTAAVTISNLSTGNHDVIATYNGNADFSSSSSATLTHGVNRADTSATLESSNPAAVAGEPLTYTAHVSAVGPGAGTPTGDVEFFVDGVSIGTGTLSNGAATSPTTKLHSGSHVITANYGGDANFAGTSKDLTQAVAAAQTTTAVSSSPNPSVVGQTVTIHAQVSPAAPSTGTPSGAVRISIDGQSVGNVDLVNGAADFQTSTLAQGSHTIVAKYLSDDPDFVAGSSDTTTQQVNKAATTTTITSSSTPSVFGQPVTLTATVAVVAPGAGAPSGTITFSEGSTVLGTAPVNGSTGEQASITTSMLAVGPHAIVATYDGDDSFLGSNGTVVQKVNRAQTSTVVVSSVNPSQSGQGVKFTATVSPVAPGAGVATGTVKFTVNGANLGGSVNLVGGVATSATFSSLSPGTYAISASYSGDGNFVASTGTLDQGAGQNIAKGATSMTVSSDDPASDYSQPVTFTSTVTAVAPATGHPSGVVQVWEGSVLLGSTSLSPSGANESQATFVTSTLPTGSHAIRAVYVGNFNFDGQQASTSQDVGQVPTTTGLTSSQNPITFGDSVTLTATVTHALAAAGVPTGTVTFSEGPNVLGTATISTVQGHQQASLVVSGLHAGAHAITATYSGGGAYGSSTSGVLTENVLRAASHLAAQVLINQQGGNGGMVRATLTGNGGAPLAGQSLVFSTASRTDGTVTPICTATTDAQGFAGCDATALLAAIYLDDSYDVDFAGNADYLPANDQGTVFNER